MTDTTKWIKKALDRMMDVDEETGKFYCKFCSKLYKHQGTMAKHIKEKHQKEAQAELQKISNKHDFETLCSLHKYFYDSLDRAIKRCQENLEKCKVKFNSGNFESFFDWNAEVTIMENAKLQMLLQIQTAIENRTYGRENEHFDTPGIKDIWIALDEIRQAWKDDVINDFPHHNSTGEFSNIVDRLKVEAKAKMVNNRFGGGFLSELIHSASTICNLLDKMEN